MSFAGAEVTASAPPRFLHRLLVRGHRWLGVLLSVVLVAWFLSGFVKMYGQILRCSDRKSFVGQVPQG